MPSLDSHEWRGVRRWLARLAFRLGRWLLPPEDSGRLPLTGGRCVVVNINAIDAKKVAEAFRRPPVIDAADDTKELGDA